MRKRGGNRKNLVAVAVLTGIVVTGGAVFTASKSDEELLQRAKDREQIEELMWRCARALDTGDAQTYASLYTVDGQFSAGTNVTKGLDALKNMIHFVRGDLLSRARRP